VTGLRFLLVAALLATLVLAALGATPTSAARHLIIISIDALRPEFYLDEKFPAPQLRALRVAGSHGRAAESVFPTVTYPSHATIATGVRPVRHGVAFNVLFEPTGTRGRWYEEASDLRAPPIWEWARAAGLTTAAVSWPSTLGARIDHLLPERDYYVRQEPLALLLAATTPGLFQRVGVTPDPAMFKDVVLWDAFLAATAAGIIREMKPNLLLLHMVQVDYFQHRGGREAPELEAAVGRLDGHVGALMRAVREAGIADHTAVIITGDHGFQDVSRTVFPNEILSRAGLRGCPAPGEEWRATVHIAGGAAAVFVRSSQDATAVEEATAALQRESAKRYTLVTRRQLDELGAMPGVALALEARPGWTVSGSCGSGITGRGSGGTHGFLPTRPSMATGLIVAGAGVRAGESLDRVRLIDVAPTAARLLGVPAPEVEGRVLAEFLK
jgi:predicted AlkP superfamily pyrophosphatase or phosphodiesterase